jgi:hypothetical protein
VFYLPYFTALATEDDPPGSLNSEGIPMPPPGASDSLKIFRISSCSQQEKSKECRMWISEGQTAPYDNTIERRAYPMAAKKKAAKGKKKR